MKISIRALPTVLTATMFLAAMQPCAAQRSPIATGAGSFIGNNQNLRHFSSLVLRHADGTVSGFVLGVEPATRGLVMLKVTSAHKVGPTLVVAGPIALAFNAPPEYVKGATAFVAMQDNGGGRSATPDSMTGTTVVPPVFGPLTAAQIVALIGPPPPHVFLPLLSGNIRLK